MREFCNEFWAGFIEGIKETPRGFFEPLIVVFRLLDAAAQGRRII